jgi:uncharacterized membrane protein YgcG
MARVRSPCAKDPCYGPCALARAMARARWPCVGPLCYGPYAHGRVLWPVTLWPMRYGRAMARALAQCVSLCVRRALARAMAVCALAVSVGPCAALAGVAGTWGEGVLLPQSQLQARQSRHSQRLGVRGASGGGGHSGGRWQM